MRVCDGRIVRIGGRGCSMVERKTSGRGRGMTCDSNRRLGGKRL